MKSLKFKLVFIIALALILPTSALATSGTLSELKNYKKTEITLEDADSNLKIFLVRADETQDRIEKKFSKVKQHNGKTYVHLRELSEILGKSIILWNENYKMPVLILDDGTEINMPIDLNIFIVDDKIIDTSSPATLDSEKTYVPLREVAEYIGYRVEYHGEYNTITLTEK